MRILRTEPECEGPSGRYLREEIVEGGKLRPRRIARTPDSLDVAGSPALTRHADGIASLFEQVRIDGKLRGKGAVEMAALFEGVNRAPCED
jgi:hypothetical protein